MGTIGRRWGMKRAEWGSPEGQELSVLQAPAQGTGPGCTQGASLPSALSPSVCFFGVGEIHCSSCSFREPIPSLYPPPPAHDCPPNRDLSFIFMDGLQRKLSHGTPFGGHCCARHGHQLSNRPTDVFWTYVVFL